MANPKLNEYMGTEESQKMLDEYEEQFEGISGKTLVIREGM